jgi:hypothetical protein
MARTEYSEAMRFPKVLKDIGSIEQFATGEVVLVINVDSESEVQECDGPGVRGTLRRVIGTARAPDVNVAAVTARVAGAALDRVASDSAYQRCTVSLGLRDSDIE